MSRPRSIPLSVPELAGNEWRYVKECLDTNWVSSVGPFVDRFEAAFAARSKARHAVAAVNGTAALHLALRAVGLEPGELVVLPDLTFAAPAFAVAYCGAKPVFMDADPATWQMDAAKTARFLAEECRMVGGVCRHRRTGRRVRALLPVHLLGLACDMRAFSRLARRYRLALIEDCAEAAGVRHRGRPVGTFGDAGCFSFNGNKVMTSGGGGMVVTGDRRIADRARYLSTQAKDDGLEYIHNEVGFNYRLTNVLAALGLAQLEQLTGFIARKRAIAEAYDAALRRIPGVTIMPRAPFTEPNFWLYTILLEPGCTLARRKAVIAGLRARGVEARPLWHPLHGLPAFRGALRYDLEHSTRLYERAVSLPSSSSLAPADQRRCVAALTDALQDGLR